MLGEYQSVCQIVNIIAFVSFLQYCFWETDDKMQKGRSDQYLWCLQWRKQLPENIINFNFI